MERAGVRRARKPVLFSPTRRRPDINLDSELSPTGALAMRVFLAQPRGFCAGVEEHIEFRLPAELRRPGGLIRRASI